MPRYARHRALLVAAALCAAPSAAAQPSPSAIEPRAVGLRANHPGPLVVREESTGEVAQATVTAPDNSFAPLSIVLVEGGIALTPSAIKRFEEAIAAPPRYAAEVRREIAARRTPVSADEDRDRAEQELDRLVDSGPLLRAVALPGGRRGYTTLLGFSRSDVTVATILPSPDGRYDLIVSVSAPFELGGLTKTLAAARYQSLLQRHPLDAVEPMALTIHRQLFPPPRKGKATPGR
jgi:hypothetical protein